MEEHALVESLPVGKPERRRVEVRVARSTLRDTWGWLWKDTVIRVLPLTGAALLYARLSGKGVRGIGLTTDDLARELLIGVATGIPLTALAAAYRAAVAPTYRLPTPADQAAQSAFYLAINAPAEELFWRGMVQTLTSEVTSRVTRRPGVGRVVGWAAATAGYASYHRLGGWSWKSIAGVAFAGGIFGALFARPKGRPTLVAPILAHGVATAGFLSWGDVLLHSQTLMVRRRAALGSDQMGNFQPPARMDTARPAVSPADSAT